MLITSQKIGEKPSDDGTDVVTGPCRMMEKEGLALQCWTCLKRKPIESLIYRIGKLFRLNQVAKEVGWLTGTDFRRKRVLVFCSEVCMEEARTKSGQFRSNRK
jgi:hypothetical protein